MDFGFSILDFRFGGRSSRSPVACAPGLARPRQSKIKNPKSKISHALLLLTVLLVTPGCSVLSFMHPIHKPEQAFAFADELPQCAKDKVYIFLIHGWDPFDAANLGGVRDFCHDLGYPNTYLAQCFHARQIACEIKATREREPDSRFVLLGYSAGAVTARDVANMVGERDGIDVSLVVYIGGWMLCDEPEDRPLNAKKVVHLLALGYDELGTHIHNAENRHNDDVWHFGAPTHPETLKLLAENLAQVATSVPVIEVFHEPLDDEAPTPRPTIERSQERVDEWDFLKPARRLQPTRHADEELLMPESSTPE